MKLHDRIKKGSSIDSKHKLYLVSEKAIRAQQCPWSEKKEIITGFYLGLRSYHVHVLSKHGITSCIYESNNIRIVVGRKAKLLY